MRRGVIRNQRSTWSARAVSKPARAANRSPCSRDSASDLQDLDVAVDHVHVARLAQPEPNGPGGGQVRAGRTVRRCGRRSSASPSQSNDSGTRYGVPSGEALATHRSTSCASRCSSVATTLRAGARGRRHRSWSRPRTLPSGSVTVATRRPPPTSCAGSLTRGAGRGHLGQLRLDVRHVPVGHRRRHALRAAARHQPDVLALDVEADVVGAVGRRLDAEQRGVHRLGRRQVGDGVEHRLDAQCGGGGRHGRDSRSGSCRALLDS